MPAGSPRRGSDDSGFTLVETIVAIGLIGTVVAAVATFMITSLRATDEQRGRQVAVQLADDAIERVRNLDAVGLLVGRQPGAADAGVTAQITGLAEWLGDMEQLNAPVSGVTAALPITPETVEANRISYRQHWFLGRCWLPRDGDDQNECSGPPAADDSLLFYRVVVAVTWPARRCAGVPCAYLSATLVNSLGTDPQFNTNEAGQPPLIANPGVLATDVGVPVDLQMQASGGTRPYTWYATKLPDGLTVGTDGRVTGTPTTAGAFTVTFTVKDSNQLISTADLNWTINPRPQVTSPARITAVGATVSVTPALTGGTGPFVWTATGLPASLSINRDTGEITGKPVAADAGRTLTSRVTVTDAHNVSASATFTWQIVPALTISVTAQTTTAGVAVTVTNSAAGGYGAYTWTAMNLPPGLTIDAATGTVRGTPTGPKAYPVDYTVTDAIGNTATARVTWTVR